MARTYIQDEVTVWIKSCPQQFATIAIENIPLKRLESNKSALILLELLVRLFFHDLRNNI